MSEKSGTGVDAVRKALAAMRDGGDFQAVLTAARTAEFTVPRTVNSLEDLGNSWDYQPEPDSFRDVVEAAMWEQVITPEQLSEVREAAFGAKHPSRQAE